MKRQTVSSPSAPAAIGPYSPAVLVSGASEMLFVSGQIGLDPQSGALVEGGVEAQAECAMKNLEALLRGAGFGLADVVRTTLYLTHMEDFAKVNAIYGARFEGDPPARATIAVAGLPKGALFEIDAVAVR